LVLVVASIVATPILARPLPTVVVAYSNSAQASPSTVSFQIGDRVAIKAQEADLSASLVGRSIHVHGTIHFYTHTTTSEHKRSCGPFGLFTCTDVVHTRQYGNLDIDEDNATRYTPFLQLGPTLVFATSPGDKAFPLYGPEAKAREVLGSGGYVYVALHDGEVRLGQLSLPANSFDIGSPDATDEERAAGRALVQSKCRGREECIM